VQHVYVQAAYGACSRDSNFFFGKHKAAATATIAHCVKMMIKAPPMMIQKRITGFAKTDSFFTHVPAPVRVYEKSSDGQRLGAEVDDLAIPLSIVLYLSVPQRGMTSPYLVCQLPIPGVFTHASRTVAPSWQIAVSNESTFFLCTLASSSCASVNKSSVASEARFPVPRGGRSV